MLTQFVTIALLMLLSVMSPGPYLALVSRNSLVYSRSTGLWTTLGIGCSILIHISYCILGLAVVITHSIVLFSMVKYAGASYLIYLGMRAFFSKPPEQLDNAHLSNRKTAIHRFSPRLIVQPAQPQGELIFLSLIHCHYSTCHIKRMACNLYH